MTGLAGFASINPDYIGYGASNSVAHPYMLKKASARSSVDMIKASMKYMQDNGIAINHQLYISGYSQGGYTAMALCRVCR
ncbi:MAG: lipase family protein [Sulfurimonas sp.]|nr:lipase family protein [Sulfurimonas sp.]